MPGPNAGSPVAEPTKTGADEALTCSSRPRSPHRTRFAPDRTRHGDKLHRCSLEGKFEPVAQAECAQVTAEERPENVMATAHAPHPDHMHQHGKGCGHVAIPHEDHVDYVHDGHRHVGHDGHWDDH